MGQSPLFFAIPARRSLGSEIGVSDSHHPLSHRKDDSAKLERLHKLNEFHFQQFAHLVTKLAATPEGDGTLLDHTVLLYGTGISDSNTHDRASYSSGFAHCSEHYRAQ